MVRDTSLEIYKKIQESGLLSIQLWEVYACIFEHEPVTIKEVCVMLRHRPETSVSPRFAQLERRGAVSSKTKRACKVTGNLVYEWRTTGKLPIKIKKQKKQMCLICGGRGYTTANS